MAVITVDDVQALSGENFDDDTYTVVDTLIPLIQGEMEGYLGRAIEPRPIVNETHLLGIERTFVYLRNTPVTSVQSISVNGFLLQPNWYFVTPMGVTLYGNSWGFGYGFAPVGANVAAWMSPTATFQVSYTGGLDITSDPRYQVLRGILIRTVLEQLTAVREGDTGRAGYTAMRVEDFNWHKSEAIVAGVAGRTATAIGSGPFTASDLQIMKRFKRLTAIS